MDINMGVLSNLAVVISKNGWKTYCDGDISLVISSAKFHKIHSNEDHLIFFDNADVESDDMQNFVNRLRSLDNEDYYILELLKDGGREVIGSYFNNPFGIAVHQFIDMNIDDCHDVIDTLEVK